MIIIKMIRLIIILTIPILLCGCATTQAENWKLNKETGQMECVQKLKLKGMRDKDVTFEDKSKLKDTSILKDLFPDIELDVDKLGN